MLPIMLLGLGSWKLPWSISTKVPGKQHTAIHMHGMQHKVKCVVRLSARTQDMGRFV